MLFFPNGFLSFPIICVYKTSVAIQPVFWNIQQVFEISSRTTSVTFIKLRLILSQEKSLQMGMSVNIKTVIEFKGKIRCYGTFFLL